MILFNFTNKVVSLYKDFFDLNGYYFSVGRKFLGREVLACVKDKLIKWTKVSIDLYKSKSILCLFYSYIL